MRERIRISSERECARIPAVGARLGAAIAARCVKALTAIVPLIMYWYTIIQHHAIIQYLRLSKFDVRRRD